jgi:hypothetical protein
MIDPGGRQTLQPGEIEALAQVFKPALSWLDGPRADPALREVLAREQAAAQRLARALEAAQSGSWTAATAHLELLLAEGSDSVLVGLLCDGRDWRDE